MGLKPCYILFNPIIRVLTNFLPGHWPQIKYFHCIVVQRKLCTCSAAAKTTGIRKTLYPGLRCWKWRLRRALELNYKMIISRLRNDLSGRWMYPMLTNANMGHYSFTTEFLHKRRKLRADRWISILPWTHLSLWLPTLTLYSIHILITLNYFSNTPVTHTPFILYKLRKTFFSLICIF